MTQVQTYQNQASGIDCFDFAALNDYTSQMVGTARIWMNASAEQHPEDQVTLFVHGAYHGAWCYTGFMRYFDRLGIPAAAIDLTGHGGLTPPAHYTSMGVKDFVKDIHEAEKALNRPTFLVGHSAGALICASAAQHINVAGLGLLTPSPPGNLPRAKRLPQVPTECPLPIANFEMLSKTYFIKDPYADIKAVHRMLCPESPALMNDRYRLQATVDPNLVTCPGFCIEAENDDRNRHPNGQDQRVARFFNLEYILMQDAPHCLMISQVWERCSALLVKKIKDITS